MAVDSFSVFVVEASIQWIINIIKRWIDKKTDQTNFSFILSYQSDESPSDLGPEIGAAEILITLYDALSIS